MAYQHLKQQKILRAGITVIERLVAAARAQAHHESLHCLRPLLTSERTVLLDGLLLPDQDTGKTPLSWLRQHARSNTPAALLDALNTLTLFGSLATSGAWCSIMPFATRSSDGPFIS